VSDFNPRVASVLAGVCVCCGESRQDFLVLFGGLLHCANCVKAIQGRNVCPHEVERILAARGATPEWAMRQLISVNSYSARNIAAHNAGRTIAQVRQPFAPVPPEESRP
jgi:hypothetical protein